ncbi:MAG: hypothetical protein HY517_03945 [Candidatus Aenigmarchaeota archaeon]|nr:hypothetical protein [Candidatus Aenigmarchaeota archaeon]
MRKCPYLSTRLECFAGSFGTARCFQHDFHSNCGHRIAADRKGKGLDEPKLLDNLVRIDF